MSTAPYDPSLNPRYLGPTPMHEAERRKLEIQAAELATRASLFSEIDHLFSDKGWPALRRMLEGMADEAKDALVALKDPGDIRYAQGQIRAFQWLTTLPRYVEAEYQRVSADLALLTEQLETE